MRIHPALITLTLALANAAPAQLNWELRKPAVSPTPPGHASMAYDPARKQVLTLVPGQSQYATWLWDGLNWRSPGGNAPPVVGSQQLLVHDPKRDRTVHVPDTNGSGPRTWEWDGQQWRDTGVPAPGYLYRSGTYDPVRGTVVTLGGLSSRPVLAFEEWDGTAWKSHPAQPPVAMTARCAAAIAFDTDRNVLVLFGGFDGLAALHDTWELSGTTWTRKFPTVSPTGRWGHAMAYDPLRRRIVLFGGNAVIGVEGDLWEWDGTNWTRQVISSPYPVGHAYHGLAYDTDRRRLVLFGGIDRYGAELNETWELYDQRLLADYRGFGSGCPGSNGTPLLAAPLGRFPRINQPFRVDLTNLPPGRFTTILVGASKQQWSSWTLPLSLAPFGMPGCTAYCSDEWALPLVNLNGTATWNFTIPNLGALAGLRFYNQAYVSDPPTNALGLIATNGGEGLIGY